MSSDSRYYLSSLSWYSTRIKMQLVLYPSSSSNWQSLEKSLIIPNDLRLVEMNSSHSKTAMTLLALRPLHIFYDVKCVKERNSIWPPSEREIWRQSLIKFNFVIFLKYLALVLFTSSDCLRIVGVNTEKLTHKGCLSPPFQIIPL